MPSASFGKHEKAYRSPEKGRFGVGPEDRGNVGPVFGHVQARVQAGAEAHKVQATVVCVTVLVVVWVPKQAAVVASMAVSVVPMAAFLV